MAEANKIKPVYYLLGEEEYLKQETLSSIRAKVVAGPMASLNYSKYEAKGIDSSEVVSVARTVPAFAHMRMVVVNNADGLKAADIAAFTEYVERPCDSTCLVFISGDKWLSKKKNAFHALMEAKGYARKFDALNEQAATSWAMDYAKKLGKGMIRDAAAALVGMTGTRLADLKPEVDKLSLYCNDSPSITPEDVAACVMTITDASAFDLALAIASKNKKAAFKALNLLRGEDSFAIVGAIAWQLRTLIRLKDMERRGVDERTMPQMLGVRFDSFPRYRTAARSANEWDMLGALRRVRDLSRGLKFSRLPKDIAMAGFVMELCA